MKKLPTYREKTMTLLNLTPSEYKKLYRDYYYRLRTFEAETGAQKRRADVELYYTYYDKKAGEELSKRRQAVLNTPAMSKATRQKLVRQGQTAAAERRSKEYALRVFGGLIEQSNIARNIWNAQTLTTKQKIEKLTDYANERIEAKKAKMREDGSIDASTYDIPSGYNTLPGWEEWE